MKSVQLKDVLQYDDSEIQKHTETKTMKLKKFDDTNIENPVNNARNLKDILQSNNISIMKVLAYTQKQ